MLCLGALINWLGLAENYIEPVRYVGVACIVTGAMLIIAAMCCWMNSNASTPANYDPSGLHVIDVPEPNASSTTKPPDYDTIIQSPPPYDEAIKLSPAQLLHSSISEVPSTVIDIPAVHQPPPSYTETTQTQPS